MHECRQCGDTHEAVDAFRSHLAEHDLHWHHCPLCGEDLMKELEDVAPSEHRAAADRVRRRHIAQESDAIHLG